MDSAEEKTLVESCQDCVVNNFQKITEVYVSTLQKVIDGQYGVIKILIIILGLVCVGAEALKGFGIK